MSLIEMAKSKKSRKSKKSKKSRKPKKLTLAKKKEFIKDEKMAVKTYKKYGRPIKAIAKDEASHAKIISRIKTK